MEGGTDLPVEAARAQQTAAAADFVAGIATVAAQAATAALKAQISAVVSQLQSLPQALVREVPAAVCDHNEAEALRLSSEALDSSLQKQIAAAASCAEIGKLPGFIFNDTENTITCEDCFRYASSKDAPSTLRHGAPQCSSWRCRRSAGSCSAQASRV